MTEVGDSGADGSVEIVAGINTQVPIASMESSPSIGGGEARSSVLAETAQGEGEGEEPMMRAEAKPLASDAALDDVKIETEEASDEPRVGNGTGKGERDRGNSGASQGGAQGASDEEMKESAEQKAEGLSNSSDRNTGGWQENAEDDEERREVKGRGRVTPKGSAHKGAFQPGSRAALSKGKGGDRGKGKEKLQEQEDGDKEEVGNVHDIQVNDDAEEEEDDCEKRDRDRHRHSELIKLGAAGAGKSGKIGVWGVYLPGRPIINDADARSRIPARLLNAELTCPICLSIVRNTHTFMECLHRFCQDCIEKYLRLGQKECPKCRVKVSSRRALRADPAFDKIIQTFYPDIDAYEEKEDEFISRVNAESHSIAAAVEEGLRRQASAAGAGGGRANSATAAIAASTAANYAESRRTEAQRAEARKRDKWKATSTTTSERRSSSELQARGGADSSVSTSTLKRAAAPEAAGASSASAPMPKRQMPTKRGSGLVSAAMPMPPPRSQSASQKSQAPAAAPRHEEEEEEEEEEELYQEDGLEASPPVTPPPPPSIIAQHTGMVEFRLYPHQNERKLPPLQKDYMCSTEKCQMFILKKFLANKLKLDVDPSKPAAWKSLDLLVNTPEQENAVIPNDLTLGTVVRMLWSRKGELKILYRFSTA